MDIPDYPPNSDASKRRQPPEEKDIKRVVSGDVNRRGKPLRRKFVETFIGGDPKTAAQYAVIDVMLPAARDLLVEGVSQGMERLIFGQARSRGVTPPQSGPTGFVSYNNRYHQMGTRQTAPQRTMSRQARARHDFDEIVLGVRAEAEAVVDNMFEIVSQYGVASVADLYALVGVESNHVDTTWGWTSLTGAGVTRVHGGFLVDLPAPEPLR